MTQKVKKDEDSDESDDEESTPVHLQNNDKDNPWVNPVKTESEIDEFIQMYFRRLNEKKLENLDSNKKDNVPEDSKKLNDKTNKVPDEIKSNEECNLTQNGLACNEDKPKMNLVSSKKNNSEPSKKKVKKLNKKKNALEISTSNWSVSPIDSPCAGQVQKNFDIDEMFDAVEDSVQEKIQKKLAKAKSMLAKEEKKERRRKKQIKRIKNQDTNDIEDLALKGQQRMKPIIDKPMDETTETQASNSNDLSKQTSVAENSNKKEISKNKTVEIDPNKFMIMKPKHIPTMLPDDIVGEVEAIDDNDPEEDQHQIISEAFADDDVVDEFRKSKDEEVNLLQYSTILSLWYYTKLIKYSNFPFLQIKKSQPESLDLTLPGWGSWGGKNIKVSSRKRRRFIVKFPTEAPRRDENKGDVVIIEEKCPKIKNHLVSELPFPFNSVQDYEASIRAPIGRDFVPEKSFGKLIQPHVKTKMGKVIEPMSEDVLLKKIKCDLVKNKKKLAKKEEKKVKKMKKGKGNK